MKQRFSLIFLLLSFHSIAFASIDRTDAEKKTKLDFYLSEIHDESRNSRRWGGGILLGLGAVSGIAALSVKNDGNSDARIALGVTSFLMLGVGTIVLVMQTDRERLPEKYLAMDSDSEELLRAKVSTGESQLELLADQERIARYWGSGILGVFAISEFAWAANQSNDSSDRGIYAINGVLFTGLAAVTLFVKRPAERYFDSYRNWVSGTESSTSSLFPDAVHFGLISNQKSSKSGQMLLTWNLN